MWFFLYKHPKLSKLSKSEHALDFNYNNDGFELLTFKITVSPSQWKKHLSQ